MRAFAVLVLLFAACDFQPGKGDKLASSVKTTRPAPTTPVKMDAGSAAPTPPPAPTRPPKPAPMATSADCEKVAIHVTGIVIDSITDANLKAAQEQDRTKLVRKVSETCTKDSWSEATRKCFLDGKTTPELEVCGRNLAAPAPDVKKPPAKSDAPQKPVEAPPKKPADGHEGHGH